MPGVVRFLLADDHFPRACVCCLRRAEEILHRLPNSAAAAAAAWRACAAPCNTRASKRWGRTSCTSFIDRLQLSLARTNDELARVYFVGQDAPGAAISPLQVA